MEELQEGAEQLHQVEVEQELLEADLIRFERMALDLNRMRRS